SLVAPLLLYMPSTPSAYTLSLHDALPISRAWVHECARVQWRHGCHSGSLRLKSESVEHSHPERHVHERRRRPFELVRILGPCHRSEEHTSELQSRENLVCRLLLEKKKTQ